MQVVAEFAVAESVVGGFCCGGGRGVEVLELGGEAHAHFEGVGCAHVGGCALTGRGVVVEMNEVSRWKLKRGSIFRFTWLAGRDDGSGGGRAEASLSLNATRY